MHMKTARISIIWIMLLNLALVYAHAGDFNETKQLIDSGISCNELSEEQLEEIGEYYMEQMHPGGSHELMHEMMGLQEGSENEEQLHINMAKSLYCGEENAFGSGGMMGGEMMNMMGDGMMGGNYIMQSSGMMQSGRTTFYNSLLNVLYLILLVGLIILVYLGIVRLWKNNGRRNEKRK